MHSDDKSKSKANGADMTADELLMLLNKTIENIPDRPKKNTVEKQVAVSEGRDDMKIDDDVFDFANSELRNSDAVTTTDDSDLDVDELIDKFITKPKNEREAAAAEAAMAANIEAATEAVETEPSDLEFVDEDDNTSVMEDTGTNVSVSEVPEYTNTQDISENVTAEESTEEITDVQIVEDVIEDEENITEAAIESTIVDEDDTKIAEVITEIKAGSDAFDQISEEPTAVFDISQVKETILEEKSDIDKIVDEAFEMSETEVFSPVNLEQCAEGQGETVQNSPLTEQVYGSGDDSEIDQIDLNLMLALGMDEELKETVGEEKATAIEEEIISHHEETAQIQSVAKKIEYTTADQNTEILTTFKNQYYSLLIRMGAGLALLIMLFLFENFSMLGLSMPSFIRPTSYPMVYAMIDLQLVVLCGALVIGQIIKGVKSLITLKPTPESITPFVLALSLIYTLVAAFTAPTENFALFNLPVAFTVLLSLVYEFMNLKRNVFSFNIVSSRRKKFVVTPVSDATESLEREAFNDYVAADANIIRVGKTDFVDGFFARAEADAAPKPLIAILLPVVLILAALFVIITFIKTGSVYESFSMAFVTTAFTMPLGTFAIYSMPFYRASKIAYDNGSTIIGESSLEEYSGSAVISFEDKEVFPSDGVKVTSIKVYGNNRIDEIIYSLASAFIKVGGPLADVFSQATHDLGHSEDVELIEVDDDGFTVTIDGVPVYLGKASYMEKKDFDPPFDSESRKQEQNHSVGILYIAYEGQLAAKVYVQYTIDKDFEGILSQLYKTGMCIGIKSFDPNIDDLLLSRKIKAMKYPVKVIRSKTVEDIPHTFERCESGIVSKRSVKSLLRTVALCERVGSVIRLGTLIKLIAMIIGVVVMVFIHAFSSELNLSSLYIMLYQLFWVAVVPLISRFFI